MQAMFDAVDDLDLEAMIAVLNPNEAEALQRYAPMFIDEAQTTARRLRSQDRRSRTSSSRVTGDGDRRTVAIDALHHECSAQTVKEVTVEGKDGCVVMTTADTTTDSCEGGKSIDSALTVLGLDENEDIKGLVKAVQDAFADMEPVGVTVQQVNGKWFVSPVGTYFDDRDVAVLGALDKDELTDIIDARSGRSSSRPPPARSFCTGAIGIG